MAKPKPHIELLTCGIYRNWDPDSKELPKFLDSTKRIAAEIGVEFGYVVNIRGAKNQKLGYCIDHPGILDSDGNVREPFVGEVYVKQNDWKFYLGDTIWDPIEDKLGKWRLTLELAGTIVADETFHLFSDA